jgi:hypothetical protein
MNDDELQLLASLPHTIGSGVAFSGSSGLFGTGKELVASTQGLLAGVKDYPGNALIQAIVPDAKAADRGAELEQARKTRDWMSARMKSKGIRSAEQFTALALEDCRAAAALLASKCTPQEAAEYKAWVGAVAEKVANAATEGGFLGFGGERLSEGEKAFIAQMRSALGVS